MNIIENNEMNFVFKINKITHLLNHVDIYYQKEILQDIKRYNNKVNVTLNNQSFNENDKKKVLYNYLNKYLDNIINDQLDYLLDAYHKDNKQKILIDSEKKAYQSINVNQITKKVDSSVDNMKNNLYKNTSLNNNDQINHIVNDKINSFFNQIKSEVLNNLHELVNKKIENTYDENSNFSNYIQKKVKEFLKLFLKNENIYNDIVEQTNNEINNIYNLFNQFKDGQKNIEESIDQYFSNNNKNLDHIEKNITNKIKYDLDNKIKILTDIFNKTIKNSIENNNLNESNIIKNLENKILNNNNFSKNHFEIKFNKENGEIELYYYNDLITSTKLNIKGLIGPKGPQGLKGEKGDITIIRNIEVNEDNTIKFTMQNDTSIYEINTINKLPTGPRGEKGNQGEKGDPGDVNINLKWNQDNVMKINKENFNNLTILKSLSVGDNSHCLKNESISIGKSICYQDNSIALGSNSQTLNSNSIALFGNTLGKNSFSYFAEDVEENCVKFGNKFQNKYNIESISLKSKEIILDCDDLILKDNNFKNNKIIELEEKINYLIKEINNLKK